MNEKILQHPPNLSFNNQRCTTLTSDTSKLKIFIQVYFQELKRTKFPTKKITDMISVNHSKQIKYKMLSYIFKDG